MRSHALFGGLAILSVALGMGATAHASDAVGVRSLSAMAPERRAPVAVTLWYPAAGGGRAERFGANPVFAGAEALRDAAVAEGVFPVIVLAHGGLRASPHQSAWIGSRLAERGYIVAAVQPPPLAANDAARGLAELGLRPGDLSAALTAVERDPSTRPHADMGKVAALGFFLGGTSALAVGGARLDPDRVRGLCDSGAGGPDCAWFAKAGVDPRAADLGLLAQNHRDARVRIVVAVDPEASRAYGPDGIAATAVPTTVINLGAPGETPPWLDAAEMAANTPAVRYLRLPGAGLFSSFGLCTPRGASILRAEGDDGAVCEDKGALTRAEVHDQLVTMITAALPRGFAARP